MSTTTSNKIIVLCVGLFLLFAIVWLIRDNDVAVFAVGSFGLLFVMYFIEFSSSIDHPYDEFVKRMNYKEHILEVQQKNIDDYNDSLKHKNVGKTHKTADSAPAVHNILPELKHSNLKMNNVTNESATIKLKNETIAKVIKLDQKQPEIIPLTQTGSGFKTLLAYLQKHDIINNSAKLKINVNNEQSIADYFASNGHKQLIVKNNDSNHVIERNLKYNK